MDFSVSKTPLYISVKNAILKAIQSGEFDQSNQLPTEKMLAEKFNVSRATIRSALQYLEDENVIKKQQGVGTFLTHKNFLLKMRIDKIKGFYQLLRDSGYDPSMREEGVFRESIDDKIAKQLNVSVDTEVLIIQRTLLGDGKPAIHLREYLPVTSLTHMPEVEDLPESILEISEQFLSRKIEYSISEIIPAIVDRAMMKTLDLPEGNPILRLEEIHFDQNNEPLIFSEVFVNDQIIRFNLIRTRDRF
ncbi:MAG: GntR family transcriptional regulator [Deltaproteobacteria bacterium]|nr:GntR family transcriptional regulator [Deltaproteobacteria bacterium]